MFRINFVMKIFKTIPLLVLVLSCCSPKYGIVKARAFVQQSVAGTIRVDMNGRPMESGVRTQHFIYVETDAENTPEWESASIGDKMFTIQAIKVSREQNVGKTMDGKKVVLNAQPNHQLWQLVLTPSNADDTKLNEPIVLKGRWKNKPFSFTISNEERLQTLEFQ